MEDMSLDSSIQHWLSIHKGVRSNIRRLFILLVLLAAFAITQGYGHQANLNQDYQFAREFSLQLTLQGPRREAADLFEQICRKNDSSCELNPISVRLESIPNIRWELDRFLNEKRSPNRFEFQGFEFDFVVFALLLLLAPLGILWILLTQIRTTGKIAKILRNYSKVGGEIQQSINSIFSERATMNIGDKRWIHATNWTLVLIFLGVLPGFFLMFETTLVLNTKVLINSAGIIFPLPDAAFENRTYIKKADDDLLKYFLAYLVGVIVLAGFIFKSVLTQLDPSKVED